MKQTHPLFEGLRGKSYGVEHILASQAGLLSEVLQSVLHLDPERTEFLRQMGSIYHNQNRLAPDLEGPEILVGDYLRVHQNPRRFPTHLLNVPESIVWENDSLLILNKPSGLPVHSTVDNTQENIIALFQKYFSKEFHVTHRLDVATQGLLVLAKTKEAQSLMNIKLLKNEVTKHYRARVSRLKPDVSIPEGEVIHFMEPSPRAPKNVSPVLKPGWQQCRLRILDQTALTENSWELIIELITGRTHQIRAQLSALGFPVLGDHAYGSPLKNEAFEKISLQAFSLSFEWNQELISLRLPNQFLDPI